MTNRSSPSGHGRSHQAGAAALLGSVSVLALVVAGGPAAAHSLLLNNGSVAPVAAAMAATQAAAAQAAAAAQQAQTSLSRAAGALQAVLAAQQAARAAAALQTTGGVPDGLTLLGLMPKNGTASNPTGGIGPINGALNPLWQGADLPTQVQQGNQTTVNINQQQQKAILTWDTFNVGRNTTVNFNQNAADWTVLNRVEDPNARPSTILGQIHALGGVYIINRNGIIFGAGSQINVHALVASDLDVGNAGSSTAARNQFFLNSGIASGLLSVTAFSSDLPLGPPIDALGNFLAGPIGGGVRVEAGATITSTVVSPDSPGFVYLFGANVANSGTITVPAGQVALVAAQVITLTAGEYNAVSKFPTAVLPDPTKFPFRGTGFQIQNFSKTYNQNLASGTISALDRTYVPGTGLVTHDGLIQAPRGIVVMNGDQVTIGAAGVISADTSITRNSMVLLDAVTKVEMNGIISMQADLNGETLPLLSGAAASASSSTVQPFTPAFVEMGAQVSVALGSSGLVSAPSASVSLNALNKPQALALSGSGGSVGQGLLPSLSGPERVLLEPGAVIDVAGLQNLELPASANFISFQPRGLEFADMPLQRNGPLFGQTLWIDIRASGTRSDGTAWVGTPLADASGFVDALGRSISQLMTAGGSVSLTTDLAGRAGTTAPSVVLQDGSTINMAGGSIHFLPGTVPTTRLMGSDGRIYSMENANPNITYVGIAGQFTANHPHWGVSETWSILTQTFQRGYTEGHDAGGLTISTAIPVLGGTLLFGSVAGERQIEAGLAPSVTGGIAPTQSKGDESPSQGYLQLTTPASVIIGAGDTPPLPDSLPSDNFIATNPNRVTLSAGQVSGYGLSALSVTSSDLALAAGSTLRLADGGRFAVVAAGAIDMAGTVLAAGGQVNLRTDQFDLADPSSAPFHGISLPSTNSGHNDIFVGGVLDVSGRWVNDTGRFATNASGPGFINGGSISLATNNAAAGQDKTGNILLAPGSLLDVSSGGYLSPSGAPKTVATGVTAGRAGNISLLLYQGAPFLDQVNGGGTSGPARPTALGSTDAQLELDGTLRGYGFAGNGTLTLGAPKSIRIGGQPLPGDGLHLPAALFNGGGFAAYVIESTPDGFSGAADGITVSAGVNLTLRQQNLASTVDDLTRPTGTKIATAAPLAVLPDALRAPVDLTLDANNILLEAHSSIVTDPKARITLAGAPDATQPDPTLRAQVSQNVLLLGSIVDHSGAVLVNAIQTWLGPQAQVDLSGAFVADARFALSNGPVVNGTLLSGGTFTVDSANPLNGSPGGGYLVAQSGARVDVSGAAGTILVRNPGLSGVPSQVASWTDAGTVSVNAGAFLWGGTFLAGATDPRANGGTLLLGGGQVVLLQTSAPVTNALGAVNTPDSASALPSLASVGPLIFNNTILAQTFPNIIVAAVDRLGTFDNVFLYSGTAIGGAGRIFTDLPETTFNVAAPSLAPLTALGDLTWNVASRLQIAASSIVSAGVTPNSAVSLAAPYVNLTGGGVNGAGGSSSLTVTGQTIDIEGASLVGFSQATFRSAGDIRLSTPKVADGLTAGLTQAPLDTSTFAGVLAASGDLTFSAQRIYPVSAVNFSIETGGTVTFQAPPGSRTDIPLSAGGSLGVSASAIVQDGHLFAPLGQITLGGGSTQSVTLGAGSLTSVSLAGTTVPFGETQDGVNWFYNAILLPLSQPAGKSIAIVGQNVVLSAGSTVDVRGGGDLQAMEFIAGKGGSRDVLDTTPSGQTVYALLPSANDPVAAFDVHFTTARSATTPGDTNPLAGTQIQLDGGNGIAAGTYTLYPAHYATLPGALRAVFYGDNLGRNVPSGTTLTDGTVLVSGHYTSSTRPGTQSSGSSLFAIQPSAVWQQYSQYAFSSANSYFAKKAAHDGIIAPRLPIDAGRLTVEALPSLIPCTLTSGLCAPAPTSITLEGQALTQAAPGGRGSELDVTAGQLVVSPVNPIGGPDYPAADGWTWIPTSQIDNFGFESVLLGGFRTDQSAGTLITPTANQVVIDTAGAALTVPELLLVAQPSAIFKLIPDNAPVQTLVLAPTPTPGGGGAVTIKSGSVIESTGAVHTGSGRNYFFAKPADFTATDVANGVGGNLQPDGTTITGVNISKLPLLFRNDPSNQFVLFNNTAYAINDPAQIANMVAAFARSPSAAEILYSYGGSTSNPGLGALFAATNDKTLTISGPTGAAAPPLTIGLVGFLPFSNQPVPLGTAVTLPGKNAGSVNIQSGAQIITQSLSLQATAQTAAITIDSNANVQANQVNLTAPSIDIVGANAGQIGAAGLRLSLDRFAGAQGLTLKAMSGGITFFGDLTFNPGPAMQHLVMDANALTGTGGNATISIGGSLELLNSGGTSAATPSGVSNAQTSLTFSAAEIDLAGGAQVIAGFANVNLIASTQVFISAPGALALGSPSDQVALNVTTPNIRVGGQTGNGSGSQFLISTLGNVSIARPAGAASAAPQPSGDIGGKLAITAANITDTGTMQAQAGTITLEATTGNVTLGAGAFIEAGGYPKRLVDVDTFVPGGKVVLQADAGNVATEAGSVIDVAQPAGGLGYGGGITIKAPQGSATLLGAIKANGGPGLGGSFTLDTTGPADLDSLAALLQGGGVTGTVDIHTHTAGLNLSPGTVLKANSITLTADDPNAGKVIIAGTIDASGYGGTTADGNGQAGGQVNLYGAVGVTLMSTGKIDASTTHSDERGGDVTIGIPWAAGMIDLQVGSTINVSGGTKGGLSGGTVTLRAPLTANNGIKISEIQSTVIGARAITVEGFVAFSTDGTGGLADARWDGIVDPAGLFNSQGNAETMQLNADHISFYTDTLEKVAQGIFKDSSNNPYGFDSVVAMLQKSTLDQSVLHVRPGIELVNPNPNINKGDITVASNWNLAAGTAFNLDNPNSNNPTFNFANSSVRFDYRLSSTPFGIEPGALTLRAAGNINVNASISDGFFQFRNYQDSTYVQNLLSLLQSLVSNPSQQRGIDQGPNNLGFFYLLGSLDPSFQVPVAPYSPDANLVSPIAQAAQAQALAAADLFPNTLRVCSTDCGNAAKDTVVTAPGSWSYRFTAGADLTSANPNATGPLAGALRGDVIVDKHSSYSQSVLPVSAGVASVTSVTLPTMVRTGTGNITIAAARDVLLKDSSAPGVIYAAGVSTPDLLDPGYHLQNGSVVASNPSGFLEPQVLAYNSGSSPFSIFGPPTAAAFPYRGGDVTILAQRNIVGSPTHQFYTPWLMSQVELTPSGTQLPLLGEGVFAPAGTSIASQSAWWIQYGSFQQGILSAGGNVTLIAGADLRDVSVSLPTTGRVGGGLSATDTPVTRVYDSGNMTVRAGGDILGGSFYEGSGHASVMAGGSVGQNGTLAPGLPDVPPLAVDSGRIRVIAGGSISTAGVLNPAALHVQGGTFADPAFNSSNSANPGFLRMDTYGPDSDVSLLAITGNLNIAGGLSFRINSDIPGSTYPASFEAIALSGNITTDFKAAGANGIILSGSTNGAFQLLAQGSVDLTGGVTPGTVRAANPPAYSAGPALLDAAFDPFRPDNGFDESASRPVLAQANDPQTARIYAATGDITGVGSVITTKSGTTTTVTGFDRIEINRPASIFAGRDIVDLNLIVQNVAPTDVSTVVAGRDITYSGFWNAGGLQVAGPGFLVVQAGRDLGPFLPLAHDTAAAALIQEGIASVGNAGLAPVGNLSSNVVGLYDAALLGPFQSATKKRNSRLPTTGADVIAQFGVIAADKIDYAALINNYINPANKGLVPHNYLNELQAFLTRIGISVAGPADAWTAFQTLPEDLQHVFADQVFSAELKAVGDPLNASFRQAQRGYRAIETLFPAANGFTANPIGGGSNGATQTVPTGDLDMLHATIQTQHGGNISLFGPGGSILVGSLATEPNSNLKLSDLGILTLGGGTINTFTDLNVLVNASRVLTTQGGDVVMWSSNGDLDAGRGSRTTLSLPPLRAVFDSDDYQTIDLGGLVTGSGIGVLKTSSVALASDLILLAPHGTIDAGDAGLRSSGNVVVFAPVVLNSSNIQAAGTTTGVPVVAAPNIGALTSASNTAGAATNSAEQPTGAVGGRDQASVFIVEVTGYGGGDGPDQQPDDEKDKKKSGSGR